MKLEDTPVTKAATCSRPAVSSAFWLLLVTCVAVQPLAATVVRAQSADRPPKMMVRVPFAPTPVPGDGGVHLVYELHVTNLDPEGREVTLKRVRAVANNGATLLRYEDSTLHENLDAPEPIWTTPTKHASPVGCWRSCICGSRWTASKQFQSWFITTLPSSMRMRME